MNRRFLNFDNRIEKVRALEVFLFLFIKKDKFEIALLKFSISLNFKIFISSIYFVFLKKIRVLFLFCIFGKEFRISVFFGVGNLERFFRGKKFSSGEEFLFFEVLEGNGLKFLRFFFLYD